MRAVEPESDWASRLTPFATRHSTSSSWPFQAVSMRAVSSSIITGSMKNPLLDIEAPPSRSPWQQKGEAAAKDR
eukprot:CAMPEP_0119063040 /NCGR_PEP_ID=MMETSP1178-20130426/6476_1 /TAXON_ID=33656 /ORGANISM="unid sp, Strain CCMP2000" /LENGTH=73 /DNA_ID=CAMNT_0007044369 /DNA_START=14 /DNA_END=231 /DNA_ORIENTATION=-